MDRKSVISLLEKEPGDESVLVAVEWIKKQKPGSPRIDLVLQKLLEIPAFESYMPWLCDHSRLGRLDFLEKMALGDRSLQSYDRVIQLLDANLEHSQCGQILAQLLNSFCDDRLLEVSKKWLCSYGAHAEGGSAVASYLLRTNRSEKIVSIAKDLALKNQKDFALICSLLEYTTEPCADELGLKLMHESDFLSAVPLAAALLKRSSRHEHAVRQLSNSAKTF